MKEQYATKRLLLIPANKSLTEAVTDYYVRNRAFFQPGGGRTSGTGGLRRGGAGDRPYLRAVPPEPKGAENPASESLSVS